MNKKALFIIFGLIGLLGLGYFGYNQFFATKYINSDTTLTNFQLDKSKTMIVRNSAKLTFEGTAKIEGTVKCERGSIYIDAKNDLSVDGNIICNRKEEEVKKEAVETGINLVVRESAEFDRNSILASNAHIQIVEEPNLLLKTESDFKKAFNEVAQDSGRGIRIGPLFAQALPEAKNTPVLGEAAKSGEQKKNEQKRLNLRGKIRIGISVGHPEAPFPKWLDLEKVPKYLDYILVWASMPNGVLNIEDAYMFTPDGHDGQDIIGGCDINVPKTESDEDKFKRNAMRMRGHARVIRVNNFHLYLGDGGKGGDAVTDKNCNPGKAVAGMGGNPSNFKWTADEAIEILGGFYIYPGKGGKGGKAVAYGKDGTDGCKDREALNGGNAYATGGNGAANPRVLSAKGDVKGLNNIYIGSMYGGDGGDAQTNPGKGGNANQCDCPGGKGGQGLGTPGKGGEVSLRYPAGVQRIPGSKDIKGNDGQGGTAVGLNGQDGPKCPKDSSGAAIPTPTVKLDAVFTPSPKKDSTSSYKLGFFEFIDTSSGKKVDYISGIKPHIIVATNGDPDVRGWLPIKLELKINGGLVWTEKIEGDPSQVCRGTTGCSTDGPQVTTDFNSITLTAYDKNGKVVATFFENQ